MKLTLKQKKFANEYLISGNATEAYQRAGYKVRNNGSARANSSRMLTNDNIKNYIEEKQKEIESQKTMDAKEAMELLTAIARGDKKETVIVSAGPNVYVKQKEADLKTRISAIKEILKRYPSADDKVAKAELRKLEAEASIAEAKAKILNDNGNDTETKVSKYLDKLDEALDATKT